MLYQIDIVLKSFALTGDRLHRKNIFRPESQQTGIFSQVSRKTVSEA